MLKYMKKYRDAECLISILGVGQIFREAELPWLMRNLNVQRISIAWKDNNDKWHKEVQWDASKVGKSVEVIESQNAYSSVGS